MGLFGTDGIRGMAGEKVTAIDSLKLGMAIGIYFKKNQKTNKILVGKDTRRSGYMIENAIVSGLTAVGLKVIQIGPFPTPAVAFIATDTRCDGAIMISASHNPYYDNGIKIFNSEGDKLSRDEERKIEKIFKNDELLESSQKQFMEIGRSKRINDVVGRYIVHIKNSFPKQLNLKGIRIVIDVANGAGYKVGPTIFKELGAEVITINDKPDGFNINKECGAIHPEGLAEVVREYRADIGIALDGDADRIVAVDENGEIINGDHLMGSLALYQKSKGRLKNNIFVTTVMSNRALDDFLAKNGIRTYRSNVGDKNVAKLMKEVGANFGGEESGHIIFSDYSSTGDGILSGLQALALMVESGGKASEIFRPFELYPQVKLNLAILEKVPFEKIEGLNKLKKDIEAKNIRHLFRYSGTENKIRLLLEGDNKKELNKLMKKVERFFKKALSSH